MGDWPRWPERLLPFLSSSWPHQMGLFLWYLYPTASCTAMPALPSSGDTPVLSCFSGSSRGSPSVQACPVFTAQEPWALLGHQETPFKGCQWSEELSFLVITQNTRKRNWEGLLSEISCILCIRTQQGRLPSFDCYMFFFSYSKNKKEYIFIGLLGFSSTVWKTTL